ncbi:beta-phosphoglucomutase [Saccharicrinis fermentans]|uniref:Beta-phosphoglucomutase n=1 Tax=Saccharicrinis fermentans DSM 9555 = JCM 21142 TaxID=869213 RepID=W7YDF7_9BACT|nr:beta-phosphoglucomutase [Saccharicrinis fermentans]GAF02521.1 putative beta-phosphoglucomutase [Saccharicrinis fermentans DSM 9555 = JCM 21142]
MGKVKACLFDLDGVIVDTAKYHYIAWKELANNMGFDFTLEDNERLKGVSRMTSLDILLSIGNIEKSEEEKLALATLKNEKYLSYILKMGPEEILPGTRDFLELLKKEGIKIALGSASKNAMTILERLELTPYFEAIIDGTKVSKAKPDPEVFLKGAEALGVAPMDCVVFEDAEAGVDAALAGGMKCVGIGKEDVLGKAHLVVEGLHKMDMQKLSSLNN